MRPAVTEQGPRSREVQGAPGSRGSVDPHSLFRVRGPHAAFEPPLLSAIPTSTPLRPLFVTLRVCCSMCLSKSAVISAYVIGNGFLHTLGLASRYKLT